MKTGDKVRITTGPYKGQTGVIRTAVANGVFVGMDGDVAIFRPVKYEHLELIKENEIS